MPTIDDIKAGVADAFQRLPNAVLLGFGLWGFYLLADQQLTTHAAQITTAFELVRTSCAP